MAAELIGDVADYAYPGYSGVAFRRCRVYRTEPGSLMVVLTERAADAGTSITNAARDILLQLERQHPKDELLVIEQYPDNEPGTRYSIVQFDEHVRPVWKHVADDEVIALLPGVEQVESPDPDGRPQPDRSA